MAYSGGAAMTGATLFVFVVGAVMLALAVDAVAVVAWMRPAMARARAMKHPRQPTPSPPAAIRDIEASLQAPENDHRGERRAARMLQRMLSLGISRHEPDPVRAIADAEQRAALQESLS